MSALIQDDPPWMDEVSRILVVKPSSLGDVVNALPFLISLRRRYPDRHIAWLVEEEAAGVLLGHPLLDHVVVSGRRRWGKEVSAPMRWPSALRETWALVSELRAGRYDLAVDLQGLLKSAVMLAVTGARVRVGFANAREGSRWVLTHQVRLPSRPMHAVDRYLEVASFLGANPVSKAFVLPCEPEDEMRADALLVEAGIGPGDRVVALNPQARWPTKLWGEDRFARLGDILARRCGARIFIIGSPSDLPLANRVAARMKAIPFVAAGRTDLRLLIALLKRVDLLVTLDSGPMHLGAALGIPLVALFGPTDPRLTGPYQGDGVVLREPLPCSPCLKRRCQIKEDRLCMRSISEAEVADAAMAILAAGRGCRAGHDPS
jgi:lipopolysaccharide heptosyltransferase I